MISDAPGSGSDGSGGALRADRIVYWPALLAVFWFLNSAATPTVPGDWLAGPFFTVVCPVMSAFIAVLLGVGYICERAWRRLVSTLILPISVVLIITFIGGW
jgi:hypothetical protein